MAADIIAMAGVASSIYSLIVRSVTNVDETMYLYGGDIYAESYSGSEQPSNVQLRVYTNPLTVSFYSGSAVTFNIAIYDFVAVNYSSV